MASGFDLVRRTHDAARAAGIKDSILQFENIGWHANYRIPYLLTSGYVRPGDGVLDWGCGNGHFSFFLESLGAQVTGYSFEPRPEAMAGSRAFQFIAGNPDEPRSLPFPDATFDATFSVGVLEHVWETGGDERSSLAELARVTKPGGMLLTFHFPNRDGWLERIVRALRLKRHFHQRKYDEAEIRELWGSAGFEIVNIGLYAALPRIQLRKLPAPLRHSPVFATAYDFVDETIARIVPHACTNFFVIARKSGAPR